MTEGTTQFITGNVDAKINLPLSLPSIYSGSYFPNDVTSVIAYFAKPVPIASGAWDIANPNTTYLFDQRTWTGIFNNTMWMDKLRGFYGLRATLRVDLVLNATPFHQGRLRLCYYPCAELNVVKSSMHKGHRTPISQLPGVDMGCGDTSVSLSIPYVAPGRFIELTSPGNVISWGDLYLVVMSPLLVGPGADSTVDYTIWYSMVDVQLFGQTYKAVQQSGVGKGRATRIMPTEAEQRPISHVLGAAANFSSAVAKIPLLSPWAGPVSWFLNAAKGAAYSFGFAKPVNSEKPCQMSNNYNWYTTTSDGLDNSMPLAVLFDAKLKLLSDISDGGEDQMSIDFIKKQWAYYTTMFVNESQTPGDQLLRIPLQPDVFHNQISTNEDYHTPVSYLSNLFGAYRGDIEIMFKFVKTGFHAGAFAFTYVPGPDDLTITLTDTSYCYRTVVDIQEGDHACFTCPYLLPLDFINIDIKYGSLFVHVVNPLRSPETCSDTIEVLVYVRGGDSLQFQKPRAWLDYPVTAQGGEVENISEDIVCSAPGQAPVGPLDYTINQDSMSECATSLLQLIKRFNVIAFEYADAALNDVVALVPWAVGCGRWNLSILTPPRQCYDPLLAQVLAPFAFYRGGMRFRTTPISTGVDSNLSYIYRSDNIDNNTVAFVETGTLTSDGYLPFRSNYTVASLQLQPQPPATNIYNAGGLSVQVPYQNVYRMVPVQYCNTSSTTCDFLTPRARLRIWTGTSKNRMITRAVADDFQALFWVGIPRFSHA
jgi:hypothetical protein